MMVFRLLCCALISAASGATLDNGLVQATITTHGITWLSDSTRSDSLSFSNDSWAVEFSEPAGLILSPSSGCTPAAGMGTKLSATVTWTCTSAKFTVDAIYELKEGKTFAAKRLQIQNTDKASFTISNVKLWSGLTVVGKGARDAFSIRSNPYLNGGEIVTFGRFAGSQTGFFASVANPFVLFTEASGPSPVPGGSSCIVGKNMINFDLPNMPLRSLTAVGCQTKCEASAKCQSFVYLNKGCDNQPSAACYLKTVSNATKKSEGCSCMGTKPFAPVTPTPAPPGPGLNAIAFSAFYSPNMIHDSTAPFDYHATVGVVWSAARQNNCRLLCFLFLCSVFPPHPPPAQCTTAPPHH
jgi:hypothetical protein